MMKEVIQVLVSKVQQTGGEKPRPASAEDLKRAQEGGPCGELLEFYRECEPTDCIKLKQRIWSIDQALIENQGAVPGCFLYPHGFIVFASTICGDSYCIDTTVMSPEGKHPVVFFSHEMIEEDTPLSEIQRLRLQVADSLEDFLFKFSNETLVDEPSYG